MKDTLRKLVFPLGLAGLVAGCVGARTCNAGKDLVSISNEGLFLFCAIPICSGDPDYPNEQVASWFANTVKVETNIRVLEETAAAQGARGVKNVVSRKSDEQLLWFILKRKMCCTSAELVK